MDTRNEAMVDLPIVIKQSVGKRCSKFIHVCIIINCMCCHLGMTRLYMLASQLVVILPSFVSGFSSWFPDLFSYISATVYVLALHGLIIILSVSVFTVYFMLSVVSY